MKRLRQLQNLILEKLAVPRFRWTLGISAGALLILAAITTVIALRPTPPPDVWDDGLDDVFGFFFDEDFNRLPPEERIKLLQQFVARFKTVNQQDSALLATFVADVTYEMRQQIEDNVLRLGVDLWSEWGDEYDNIPPSDRENYIRSLIAEMDKMGEGIEGKDSDRTDAQRVEKIESQADRDRKRMQENAGGNKPPGMDEVTGFINIYSNEFATRASAKKRAKIIRLSRDMTRYLRGESINENNKGGG